MPQLEPMTYDFGEGPVTIYGRKKNLREAAIIEGHKKLQVSFDSDGNQIQTVVNSTEWLTHVFLTLAKDSDGHRMFVKPEDIDRVWTRFDEEEVYKAAGALLKLGGHPGN